MSERLYTFLEFAKLLNVRENSIWHIIDVGDIRPHTVVADFHDKPLAEVIEGLRFSDADVEVFRQEFRRRRHEDFKIAYADVYVPDEGPGARGLEFGPGWIGIVMKYCDQLRAFERDHFVVSLRWGKEKFGALRLFTRDDPSTLTTLQRYWLSRVRERARRLSLRTCQECGQPGRLRLGAHAATLCDRHKHLVGVLRPDDGIILDPDRTDEHDQPTWTDVELSLDEGQTMDLAKQMEFDFRPFLSPALRLDGTDQELADLRRKLLAVDQAIGRHHEIRFQKRARGYEIAIDTRYPMSTVDEIRRDKIIAEIEPIMNGGAGMMDERFLTILEKHQLENVVEIERAAKMILVERTKVEFRPFLSPNINLSAEEEALADLRTTLLQVDRAIGRHHAVQFKLFDDRYEITIDNDHPTSTVDAIQRERIVDKIEMIMSGEQV